MSKIIEQFVVGLLWKDKRIPLLPCSSDSGRQLWQFPGGKIQKDETPEQALIRNMKEQLHIHVDVGGKLTACEYEKNNCHLLIHCYFCTADSSQTRVSNTKWIYLAHLSDIAYGHAIDGEYIDLIPEDKALVDKLTSAENDEQMDECHHAGEGKVLWGYESFSSYGGIGDFGGHEVIVFESGKVVYNTYAMGYEHAPITHSLYQANEAMIREIKETIAKHTDELNAIPEYLENHSCDGSRDSFIFGNKWIEGYNIKYISPEKLKELYLDHYIDLKECMQENKVLEIFGEVASIFNQHHVGITFKIDPSYIDIVSEK